MQELLSWEAPEFIERKKNVDWFWVVGGLFVVGIVLSVLDRNFFFAIFLLISSILMFYYSTKKAEILNVRITDQGVVLHDKLFTFDSIKSFDLQERPDYNVLLLHINRFVLPVVSTIISESVSMEQIDQILSQYIQKEELEHPLAESFMDRIGF
ncbi:hypothetical protein KC842_01880 [Candidatus Nomurabacteria bacterium]|nr:hypothetical protein [Candidatus Nomurabacteria bacterium]USN94641.1 MAG: hypothetical protein H6791_02700 [Candidatus Nomurabacteria bacterium]